MEKMIKMLLFLQTYLANYIHHNGLYVNDRLGYSSSDPQSFSFKLLREPSNESKGKIPGALITNDSKILKVVKNKKGIALVKLNLPKDALGDNTHLDIDKIKTLHIAKEEEHKVKFFKIRIPDTDLTQFVYQYDRGNPKTCLVWGRDRLKLGECGMRSYLKFQSEYGFSNDDIKKLRKAGMKQAEINEAIEVENSEDLVKQMKDDSSDEQDGKENQPPKKPLAKRKHSALENEETAELFTKFIDEFQKGFKKELENYVAEHPIPEKNAQPPNSGNNSSHRTSPMQNLQKTNPLAGPFSLNQNRSVPQQAGNNITNQNPNLLNSQNPNLLNSQNPSLLNSQNPSLLNSQNPSLLNSQNPSLLNSQNPSLLNSQNPSLLNSQNPSLLNSSNLILKILLLQRALENDDDEGLYSAEIVKQLIGNNQNSGDGINQLLALSLLKRPRHNRKEDALHPHEGYHSMSDKILKLEENAKIKEQVDNSFHQMKEYVREQLEKNKKKSGGEAKKKKGGLFSALPGPLAAAAEFTPQGKLLKMAENATGGDD